MNRLRTTSVVFAASLVIAGLSIASPALADDATTPAPTASPSTSEVQPSTVFKTVYWDLPSTYTGSGSIWPQSLASSQSGVSCGTGYEQRDDYPDGTAAEQARTDAILADGVLTEGEDYGWATNYAVIKQTPCATPPVVTPPTVTVSVTDAPSAVGYCAPGYSTEINQITIPKNTHISFSTDEGAGQIFVKAKADTGYTLKGQSVWHFTVETYPYVACPTTTSSLAPSAPVKKPVAATQPDVKPAAVAASSVKLDSRTVPTSAPIAGSDSLAYTGSSDECPAIALAAGLLALGGVLVIHGRRKRSNS